MRFVIALVMLSFPLPVLALEFSEIAYDLPGADDKREWIEVVNNTEQPVDMTGFYFFDGSYHVLVTPPEKGGQGSLTLDPGQYAILADDAATFLSEHANFSGTVIDTVMSLPNYSSSRTEPIELRLTDNTKSTLTTVNYLPTKNSTSGYTLERKADSQWLDSTAVGGTPGNENSPIKVVEHVAGVRLNEFMPNPTGSDTDAEWLELENTNDLPVDISGWYVTDNPTASGSTKRFTIPEGTTMASKSYLSFILPGSMLNNNDETLHFYWPDDVLIDSIAAVGTAKDDWAWARFESGWAWTDQATPGNANLAMTESVEKPSSSSSKAAVEHTSKKVAAEISKIIPKTNPGKESLVIADSATSSQEKRQKKSSSSSKNRKLIATSTPLETASPTEERPIVTAQVAGVSTQQDDQFVTLLALVLLPVTTFFFIISVLIYKYKLLLLIPKLKEAWPPEIVK